MSMEILGRRENQHLELKSSGALNEPSDVAREVVGMLNADGGEVWIGVGEEDGKAVSIEAIPAPERARDRLRDYLLEVVDPSPTADEVTIELVPPETDPALVVVKVRPPGRRAGRQPFAFRKRGGWHFVRRTGARNHPMSRQEIFGGSGERDEPEVDRAVQKLEEARRAIESPGLWVGLQPARQLDLDPEDDRFGRIALDPSFTGNRRAGWHFARSSSQPKPVKSGIEWGLRDEPQGPITRVELTEDGGARFWAALEHLQWKGDEREIWPLALLELPVSALRIARFLYQGLLEPEDRVATDLALLGAAGWGLRKGTPGGFFSSSRLSRLEEPELVWKPLLFPFREIDEAPDRCGFRLVRRVYHAFGFRETEMPRQYDQASEKLLLPE
jgi:hypothetical protein